MMKRYKQLGAAVTAAFIIVWTLASCAGGVGNGAKGENTANGGAAGTAAGAAAGTETGTAAGTDLEMPAGTVMGDAYGASDEVVFTPPSDTPAVRPTKKEESVYVKADASGIPTKTEVEVTLKGVAGQTTDGSQSAGGQTTAAYPIEDYSFLRDIRNTEGDEEYTRQGENRYLWENHGEDIHYKGYSDEPLPVSVRVSYYLDGVKMSPQQIAGKSGEVRIRFDYDNREHDVPFLVMSALMLPEENFTDIEVENGRVLEFDDQSAVIGYALPGLADSLKLSAYEPTEEVELPEYVEVTARAADFKLEFTATVITTGLFGEIDEADLDDMEELSDDMTELTDASSEISDAAAEIADGSGELGGYLGQYFDGVELLSQGAGALDKGLLALQKNSGKLVKGAESLEKGLSGMETALGGIDLSALTSGKNDKAAGEAAAAIQSLGQNTALLSQALVGIRESVEASAVFAREAQEYSERVELLRAAADSVKKEADGGALSISDETRTAWAQKLNESATASAKAAAKEAGTKAAEDAAAKAARNAGEATAAAAKNAVAEAVTAAVEEVAASVVAGAVDSAVQGAVGKTVEDAVDSAVNDAVNTTVGDAVESAVGDAVDNAVGDAVDDAVGDVVDAAVESAVNGSGALDDESLGLTDEQKQSIKNQLISDIKAELGDEISSKVKEGVSSAISDDVVSAISSDVGSALSGDVASTIAGNVSSALSDDVASSITSDVTSALRNDAASGIASRVSGGITPQKGEDVEISVDTDGISVSVDTVLTEIAVQWQDYISNGFGSKLAALDSANKNVGTLEIPDLSFFAASDSSAGQGGVSGTSGSSAGQGGASGTSAGRTGQKEEMPELKVLVNGQEVEIGSILTQMEGSLGVIAEYGKGASALSGSLSMLSSSMKKLKRASRPWPREVQG